MIKILFVSLNNKELALYTTAIFNTILKEYKLTSRFTTKEAVLSSEDNDIDLNDKLIAFAQSKNIELKNKPVKSLANNSELLDFDYLIALNKETYTQLLKFTHPSLHYKIDDLDSCCHLHSGKELKRIESYDEETLEEAFVLLNNNLHDLMHHITKD